MNRNEALELLKDHVKSEQLYRHSLAVEAAMIAYAKHFGEDVELWGNLGLLHDIDFEKYPEQHPQMAPKLLEPAGVEQGFIDAVLSHGLDAKVMRTNTIRKALSAVDQMSSFIIAIALMRPTRLEGLKAKSVKKKMKDKAFAKAIDRAYLEETREDLGVEFAEHVDIIVKGLINQEERLNAEGASLL
ncbi:HDIG domain-containing metalloprotein [Vallitalea guaymasensis]|uniref:HDIG domain-containing metalloprotein n=1 Tax=Vallitalea guaymasensis TaxID=1185412 RepID=UPI00235628DB|nr:HDIG domain-containing metalloprotein [Vallitalea guaymasensis]